MYHLVTNYGAVWATSKENNVINPVNGTVSQNTLPGVVRIFCVVEPIFRIYTKPCLLRSDSVCSSFKSLKCFPCISDFGWGKNTKSNGVRSSENGACCILSYLFLSFTPVSPSANLLCCLYTLLYYTRVFPLNMNLNVFLGIILADTQNFMALWVSFDGVTSLIFPISYHDHFAISYISNIKQPTKEHQTSEERRHEPAMMSFDVCMSLTPICLFLPTKLKGLDITFFLFFQSAP